MEKILENIKVVRNLREYHNRWIKIENFPLIKQYLLKYLVEKDNKQFILYVPYRLSILCGISLFERYSNLIADIVLIDEPKIGDIITIYVDEIGFIRKRYIAKLCRIRCTCTQELTRKRQTLFGTYVYDQLKESIERWYCYIRKDNMDKHKYLFTEFHSNRYKLTKEQYSNILNNVRDYTGSDSLENIDKVFYIDEE